MTSTVSLINPARVSISLIKEKGKELYSVVLNLFGEEEKYIGTLTTDMVSTSKTLVVFHAYSAVKNFYGAVSATSKVYEDNVLVDSVNLQELIDQPDKIRGEVHYSGALH